MNKSKKTTTAMLVMAGLALGSALSGCTSTSTGNAVVVQKAGGISTAAYNASVAPKETGPLTMFVLDCYDRAFRGEAGVYDDCFTEDFKAIGPETKMMSPHEDGSLRGRSYIKAYHDMNHGDAVAWGSAKFQMLWSVEVDNMVIRLMRGIYSESKGSYIGITDIPSDHSVTINGVFVDWIEDGKIKEQFFGYDTLNFLLDTAQGDFTKAGKGLLTFGEMVKKMQQGGGETFMPPTQE